MTQILVIEDDSSVRILLLKLLQAEGFSVICAEDGYRGIQLAQIHQPDLVICDIMMPECDGYEVLSQIRQNPAIAAVPFIFLTAKSSPLELRQGMNLGADDYLIKPFKRAELLSAITARLAKQEMLTKPYIDEMKRAAQSLSQMAYRDPLTDLPNRILLYHQFQTMLPQMGQSPQVAAVLYINLRQFKAVNTDFGYASGDLLLKAAAQRLQDVLGQDATVARLGADEFCALVPQLDQEAIVSTAESILKVLHQPYDLDEHSVQLHSDIGIAQYPAHSDNLDRLLIQADTAMRCAKVTNSGFQLYTPEMDVLEAEQQILQSRLHQALEQQQFQLYYQPQINLITGRIVGVEALLRWQEPELGLLHPGKFIAIAETTGLIVPIGEWVLRTACNQAKIWQSKSHFPIRISINLSTRQFRQEGLMQQIDQILAQTQLDASALVIELTETSIMEHAGATALTLKQLKERGFQISIDDFGIGYSSLNYLKQFPIDILKIDQSFIRGIPDDSGDTAITKAIIALTQSMHLKAIAEGVETLEQYNFLRQHGCYAMQGYLFSRAVTADEFEELLVADRRFDPAA